MPTDPILVINLCFEKIYPSAKVETPPQAAIILNELQLQKLTIEQQVLKLYEKMTCLNKEMKTMKGREYAHDIASEAVIFHIFLGRFLFNNINDECLIRHGMLAKGQVRLLDEVFKQLIAQLPPSTYDDFLKSDSNALLHDLKDKPDLKLLTDYLAIKSWQTEKTIECVKLASSKMIERLMASSGDSRENTLEITSEIQQIDYLFKNATLLSASQFIKGCQKIQAFDTKWQPEDKVLFHQFFCDYLEDDYQQPSFNAPFLQANLEKIRRNQLADAPLCCWSLINYKNRLEESIANHTHPGQSSEPSFDTLFCSIFLQAYHNNKELSAFKKKYSSKKEPADEYKKFLMTELEKYRLQYKRSEVPEYYHLLLSAPCLTGYKIKGALTENSDFYKFYISTGLVRNYFVNNCLKGTNIGKHTEELKQMIKLHKMIVFLTKELRMTDESYQDATMKEILLNCRIFELIASMIPTEIILDQLMDIGSACFTQIQAGLPVYIIAENLNESLKENYYLAENHLKKFLKTQTIDHKIMYITDLSKDLMYLLKDIKPEEQLLRYLITELQYLLKIEMKDIKAHIEYPLYEPDHHLQELEIPYGYLGNRLISQDKVKEINTDQHLMTFTYENKRADHLPLVFDALKKLKAIPQEVTLPQFRKLFNGQQVISPVNWLATPGDLKVFIKEATDTKMLIFPYQQQWHIAVRCFVKADGSAFNALSLKAAQPGSRAMKFAQAGRWLKG